MKHCIVSWGSFTTHSTRCNGSDQYSRFLLALEGISNIAINLINMKGAFMWQWIVRTLSPYVHPDMGWIVATAVFIGFALYSVETRAAYEEVEIYGVERVNIVQCPALQPGEGNKAGQSAWLWNYREMPSEQGIATLVNIMIGATMYQATGKIVPALVTTITRSYETPRVTQLEPEMVIDRRNCPVIVSYKVSYTRKNGKTGILLLSSRPSGKTLLVNF